MEFFSSLEVATWLDYIGFKESQKTLFAAQVLGQVVVDVIVGCCGVSTIVRRRGQKSIFKTGAWRVGGQRQLGINSHGRPL